MRKTILKQAAAIMLTSVSLPVLAQDTDPALSAAYAQYAAARIAMSQTEAGTPEAAAQTEAAIGAQTALKALCADMGTPELAACFDQFIAADMRVANDTTIIAPVAVPLVAAPTEPEPPKETPVPQPEEVPATEPVEQPAEPAKPEVPPAPTQPAPEAPPVEVPTPTEQTGEQAQPAQQEQAAPASVEESKAEQPPAEPVEDMAGANVPKEEVAPLLDSAKEAPLAEKPAEESTESAQPEAQQAKAEEPAAPAPKSDAEAQAKMQPQKIEAVDAEKGEPLADQNLARAQRARSAPEAAKPVQQDQSGFRIVFQFGDQLIVENQDSPRLVRNGGERTVEQLRRGRTRETITRRDGTRVVTIYNSNGDILRRSRFTPDGREIVLVYVNEDRENDLLQWRDPGRDLPPLHLNIPARDYVLDAYEADEDTVIRFLDQPPVENVRRLYSIDEVKRSARLRDSVRRLEIGGLTFQTGKATIAPDQINALSNTANAMLDLLDDNPAETFLIEGHTDAVGSDISNLDLSDRRAETIAVVLSEVFGIPPENLATQGYGERYLKVRTPNAERLNRRVTIRRITPLVAPIAQR